MRISGSWCSRGRPRSTEREDGAIPRPCPSCCVSGIPCSGCTIPASDLTLAVSYYKYVAGSAVLTSAGSMTAAYSASCFDVPGGGTMSPYWLTGCFAYVDKYTTTIPASAHTQYGRFAIGCVGGLLRAVALTASDTDGLGNPVDSAANCAAAFVDNADPACDAFVPVNGLDGHVLTGAFTVVSCSPPDFTQNWGTIPNRLVLHLTS